MDFGIYVGLLDAANASYDPTVAGVYLSVAVD
jgi:hypothetical protein